MIKNLVNQRNIFDQCGKYDAYTEINGPRLFKITKLSERMMLDDGTLLSATESVGNKLRTFFPQHHHLDAIHRSYPNATLILNQRSVRAWVDSVMSWDKTMQYRILNEFYQQESTRFLFENSTSNDNNEGDQTSAPPPFANSNTATNKRYLEIVYNYHTEHVRDFVARHPSHALVEVNIDHDDAGTILAESFGLNADCWGHFNKKNND